MQSLFSKIFVCFLLSYLLAGVLVYALLTATRPEPPPSRAERQYEGVRPGRAQRGPGRPPGRRRRLREIELIAFLVAATCVSYGLARYLASPAAKLRSATHQLAAGDLSTRVAAQMGKRRDELADLGRDFDEMAERIESLLLSEKRLLGDISHELRSPLARLQVALDLAEQTADDETRSYLLRIERESERLNILIGQLLTFTRLETLAVESRREPVDITAVVLEVAADAEFEARSHNRAVHVTETAACHTRGNAELLRSAIENVVRNAVHYTPEGSAVEIALKVVPSKANIINNVAGEVAIITVRDFGPGVPEESLPKLFKPFYRVADARDRQSGGVGLGLSITARAVKFHHGKVSATNSAGGGLLMQIELPVVALSQ